MSLYSKVKISLISLVVLMGLFALQTPSARGDDVVHVVSGAVKHIDKGTKTMVVKTSDGTEHTIKWTGKTTWEGTKKTGEGVKEGSKVSVKYTEEGGEKTAVGVKHLGKDTAKAMQ
jgi:hypothetical protein